EVRAVLLVLGVATADRREYLVVQVDVALRISGIAVDRLVDELVRGIMSTDRREEGIALVAIGRRAAHGSDHDVAILRVHVELFFETLLLAEIIEAGDEIEVTIEPLPLRRDELELVVLAPGIVDSGS